MLEGFTNKITNKEFIVARHTHSQFLFNSPSCLESVQTQRVLLHGITPDWAQSCYVELLQTRPSAAVDNWRLTGVPGNKQAVPKHRHQRRQQHQLLASTAHVCVCVCNVSSFTASSATQSVSVYIRRAICHQTQRCQQLSSPAQCRRPTDHTVSSYRQRSIVLLNFTHQTSK